MRWKLDSLAALACLVLVASGAGTAPVNSNPNIMDVKEWWGQYSITVVDNSQISGTKAGLPWTQTRSIHRHCDGTFHLNKTMAGGVMFGHDPDIGAMMTRGRVRTWMNLFDVPNLPKALVSVQDAWSGTSDQHVEGLAVDHFGFQRTEQGLDTISTPASIQLIVDNEKKQYSMVLPYDTINSTDVKVNETRFDWEKTFDNKYTSRTTTSQRGGPTGKPDFKPDKYHHPEWIVDQKFSDSTTGAPDLDGSVVYNLPLSTTPTGHTVHVEISWHLSPRPPSDEELIIEPVSAADYSFWRPEASMHAGQPGAQLAVRAMLRAKTGQTLETATRITFTLEQVSHEPGICINYPLNPSDNDSDLKFVPEDNKRPHTMIADDATAVVSEDSDAGIDRAWINVSSFDYGAFAVISAKAELQSGRVVTAHLATDANIFSLRIPKSRADSHIAEIWRRHYIADGADGSDDENVPVGDGIRGDGFTLFDEYRGYISHAAGHADGYWDDLDPTVKDLFVVNTMGEIPLPGMRLLEKISNLRVHELAPGDILFNRVVNFNYSAYGRHVDQHALVVQPGADPVVSHSIGGPGNPKKIQRVELCVTLSSYPTATQARITAHELLHSVNVYHHGDIDPWFITWTAAYDSDHQIRVYPADLNAAGNVSSVHTSHRIKLFDESAPEVEIVTPTCLQLESYVKVYVAVPHGQHSGDEDCVMRYDVAMAYPKGPPDEYYWVEGTEPAGDLLCNVISGHTINKPDRTPRPRYYEADQNAQRGFCQRQILVNDGVNPPPRFGIENDEDPLR